MTGLIELGIVAGVGAVAYGAHKTGALRKIYTGILGKVDSIAEKVKDPIVEMQLKQARLVEHSGKLAEIAKEANGKKHQIEESKKDIEVELAKLVPEYEAKLVELKEKGSDIDGDEAQRMLFKKSIIDLKRKTLENVTKNSVELETRFNALRTEITTIHSQLELITSLIDAAKMDRDILRLRGEEIHGLLNGELDVDKILKDIKQSSVKMEGEIEAAEILKSDIKKQPGTIKLSDLEL